jgi:DNA modification methylase
MTGELKMKRLICDDCMKVMKTMPKDSVDLTLTDIPYGEVSRQDNGLVNLDKEDADIVTFDLAEFLTEVYRVTKGTIIIFCGMEQFSKIYEFYSHEHTKEGTIRQIVWHKTNPMPLNRQYNYLSATENAVWFRKRGSGVFNAKCKHNVFDLPKGVRNIHPTQKNVKLFEELVLDNSNEGQMVFDPCMGSATTGLVALQNGRNFIGIEKQKKYFEICEKRLDTLD